MIIVMKHHASESEIKRVEERLIELGFATHPIYGEEKTVIGAIGDRKVLSTEAIINMAGVENLVPIMKPYKLVSRELKTDNTVVMVGDLPIGGEELIIMAGPCAVEDGKQVMDIALAVKKAGAQILRGGAYKPRSSPYAFQGLEEEGLILLAEARAATGLKIVTEAVDTRDVEVVAKYADVIQIGARNMQNFRLLKEAGQSGRPILLKRGLSATIEEWLMAAEYIISTGNTNIILCERGIRSYETATRNTLDLSAIPVVKEVSHLPIIVDPSHATGISRLVLPMSKGALAVGADGLLIEVHPDPSRALCDGPQSLNPEEFIQLMKALRPFAQAAGRTILETEDN